MVDRQVPDTRAVVRRESIFDGRFFLVLLLLRFEMCMIKLVMVKVTERQEKESRVARWINTREC
jgi:hypothetical protein